MQTLLLTKRVVVAVALPHHLPGVQGIAPYWLFSHDRRVFSESEDDFVIPTCGSEMTSKVSLTMSEAETVGDNSDDEESLADAAPDAEAEFQLDEDDAIGWM